MKKGEMTISLKAFEEVLWIEIPMDREPIEPLQSLNVSYVQQRCQLSLSKFSAWKMAQIPWNFCLFWVLRNICNASQYAK